MITAAAAKQATWWIGVVVVVAAALVAWHFLPVRDWIQSLQGWIGQLGAWGIIVFAAAYIVIVVLLAPADIMSIAAGLIFGFWGIPLVVIAATIGATCAFLIARYLVRAKVRELTQRRRAFKLVDTVVREEGWRLVALFRLNPLVPFNLQNYFFGATDIGLLPYFTATFFGIMPGTVGYVYLGTLGQIAVAGDEASTFKIALLGVGLLATIVLIWIAGRRAKTILDNLQAERDQG